MKKIIIIILSFSFLLVAADLNINFNDGTGTEIITLDSIGTVEFIDDSLNPGSLNINFSDESPSDLIIFSEISNIELCNELVRIYIEIINANIRWINPDTIRTNVVPLLNYTDSTGVYWYCPSGKMVCESMNLRCLGMEYKTTTIAGPEEHNTWIFINRSIDGILPCDFINMTEQKSYSYSTIYLPYGVFFYGINRKWDGFGLNTIRGANYYNFTLTELTNTSATFKVGLRFEADDNPQTLTINKGSMKIFDQKENTKIYVRGIDTSINVANVTIVQEADTTFRVVCGECLKSKDCDKCGESEDY